MLVQNDKIEASAPARSPVPRRDFLKAAGGMALASAALKSEASGDTSGSIPPTTQPAGIRTGPYLQNPAPDGMTVMWVTTSPSYGYVEYGMTLQLGSP